MPVDPTSTFYEEDEPVEEIEAAWERGVKGRTARPLRIPTKPTGITIMNNRFIVDKMA